MPLSLPSVLYRLLECSAKEAVLSRYLSSARQGVPRRRSLFLLAGLLLLLSGCSAPQYTVISGLEEVAPSDLPVWPTRGDVPRYQLAGIYYGEQNLKLLESEEKKSYLKQAAYWLVGLFAEEEKLRQLQAPQGGVVDENGTLYVADTGSASIFVFDRRPGEFIEGELPIWTLATQRQPFLAPIAMALGAAGELLVTDAELAQVYRLDRTGQPLGRFGEGVLSRPTGIARDAARGEIYVADTQKHDIKVFDDQGQLLRTLGSRGTAPGQLNFPIHLAFAQDSLYVVDSMNARVQRLDRSGQHLMSFGSRGTYQGQFARPKGIGVDRQGNVYVADSYVDNLLVFNPEGKLLLPISGLNSALGRFYLPAGVWTDHNDHIYLADMGNGRVLALRYLGGSQP